ncbi:MAG: AMP-binding protein [Sphingobium phenoxybenzoativorans]
MIEHWTEAGDESVLPRLLQQRANEAPQRIYAEFEDGESWTYARCWSLAQETAAMLASYGLGRGEVLLLWVPNGPDFLRLWMGANLLGAIVAAPNLAYRGNILEHVINLTGARIAAIDSTLMNRLEGIDSRIVETIIVTGDGRHVSSDCRAVALPDPDHMRFPPAALPIVEPWDPQFIIFTSGTTGPSKGVTVPYAQMHAIASTHYGSRFGPDDRYLLNLPLFHVGGLLPAVGAMITGGTVVVMPGFKTDRFWATVRDRNITGCTMIGAAASFLENLPPTAQDGDNPLRWVSMFPLVRDTPAFARRFGIGIFTGYGMSELSIPITSDDHALPAGSCGYLRDDYEALLVDEHDMPVAEGDVGELILRPQKPWIIFSGYWRNPEATAEAWRNGWFHTGDTFRRLADGAYIFVDRTKDALRRRGENISSYEVEVEILAHPSVVEAAVIGVPSLHGEQDVMAVVVRGGSDDITPAALIEFLKPRLPGFMLPRYIRFTDTLPRTPSLRVQKHVLREDGVTPDSWDRLG